MSHLQSFFDRVLKLANERADLTADIAEVLKEAEGAGFDPATIRRMVSETMRRERDPAAFDEREELFDIYRDALQNGTAPPRSTRVEQAAELFRVGKSVRDVAKALGISKSEAGRLRQLSQNKPGTGTADNVVRLS